MSDYIHPRIVNAYMSYMKRTNPGLGMPLEEFARTYRDQPEQEQSRRGPVQSSPFNPTEGTKP